MNSQSRIVLAIFSVSLGSSIIAATLRTSSEVVTWLAAPALVLSGWSFFGHLVTLSDDMPGEWSNPQESKTVWSKSLGELLLKLLMFVTTVVVVASVR